MKTKTWIILAGLLLGVILCIILFLQKEDEKPVVISPCEIDSILPAAPTLMSIYNATRNDVLVYITLGTTPGCIQNVLDIPFVTDTVPGQRGLQGTFILKAGDSTLAFAPDGLGYNGVISFNYAPDNCSSPAYPNGINQFEFIIDNAFQGPGSQETVDISCVHGTNCIIRVDLGNDSSWNASPARPVVQSFVNDLNRNAVGLTGVYPYGCDNCTASDAPPSCVGKQPQFANALPICNVQRPANSSAGVVHVIFEGFTPVPC